MLKTIGIAVAILALVAVAGVAWAKHSGYCSPEHRIERVTQRIGHKLDLNSDQQARLEVLAEQVQEMRGAWQDRRANAHAEAAELLSAPTLDRERAMAIVDDRLRDIDDAKRTLVDAFADFSDSLTPEQRTRMSDWLEARMTHRWGPGRWAH